MIAFITVYASCIVALIIFLFLGFYSFYALWTDSDIYIVTVDIPYAQEMKEDQIEDEKIVEIKNELLMVMENPFDYSPLEKLNEIHIPNYKYQIPISEMITRSVL